MTTATFAPPLNEVKPSLSNAVFSVRSLLLWSTIELEIPPRNEGIYHCIRVKNRCLSRLSHIRERLLSKDAWDAEWDMNFSAWAKCVWKFDKILLFANVKYSGMLKIQKIYVFSRPQTPNYLGRPKGKNHKSNMNGICMIYIELYSMVFICGLVKRASCSTFSQKG